MIELNCFKEDSTQCVIIADPKETCVINIYNDQFKYVCYLKFYDNFKKSFSQNSLEDFLRIIILRIKKKNN